MKKTVDDFDEAEIKKLEAIKKDFDKKSNFKKITAFNSPKICIPPAVMSPIVIGTLMPIFGVILSKILTYMTSTWEILDLLK